MHTWSVWAIRPSSSYASPVAIGLVSNGGGGHSSDVSIRRDLNNPVVFVVLLTLAIMPLAVIFQWAFAAAHWAGPSQALGG